MLIQKLIIQYITGVGKDWNCSLCSFFSMWVDFVNSIQKYCYRELGNRESWGQRHVSNPSSEFKSLAYIHLGCSIFLELPMSQKKKTKTDHKRERLGVGAKNIGQSEGKRHSIFWKCIQKDLFLVYKVWCISPNFRYLGEGQKRSQLLLILPVGYGKWRSTPNCPNHLWFSWSFCTDYKGSQNKVDCHLGTSYSNVIKTLALKIIFPKRF